MLLVGSQALKVNRINDQEKFSVNGNPLHGIVGWDDLYMKPTQSYDDGARSYKADKDDF